MSEKLILSKEDLNKAPLLNLEGLHRDLGKTVVVAPHPDDESLGCGGLLALLSKQKSKVWVIFMTNGEASHPNSKSYPPQRLGELRQQEALKACEILGISAEQVIFLDVGDGKLPQFSKATQKTYIEKLSQIFSNLDIDTVFTPWRRDHHSDHLATTNWVREAIKKQNIVLVEYPVWLWKKGSPADWPTETEILPFRLEIGSVIEQKKQAIAAHRSQTSNLIPDDPDGFLFSADLLKPFTGDYEYFFFNRQTKAGVPPSYFSELYESDADPWNFENSAYEHEKYRASLACFQEKNFTRMLEIGCANGVFTKMLAPQCDNLLALDLNEIALRKAEERCAGLPQCRFLQLDVTQTFPQGFYDGIVLSEVGYYLIEESLLTLFEDINRSLMPGGSFLMVHWTAYVRNYPLTGKEVHRLFKKNFSKYFRLIHHQNASLYEIQCWEKIVEEK